jgi:glycosyltransferase involved in cell wall biosynthesis
VGRTLILFVAIALMLASVVVGDSDQIVVPDNDSTEQDSPEGSGFPHPSVKHKGLDGDRSDSNRTAVPGAPEAAGLDVRQPLISVIIPTHDRAGLLRQAIESVLASPLVVSPEQVVVVDDDSHDETSEVVRQCGVRYLRTECRSAGGSRNAGLALAQTPYVAFLDDDDVWLPGNMEAQLAALEANPTAGFAYGMIQFVTEDLKPLAGPFPPPPLPSGLAPHKLHLSYPQIGVVLFRREALAEVGGFDLRIRYFEDAHLMAQIAARHDIVGLEVLGMLYRDRTPSKARSDYFWAEARREVTHWRPRHLGIGWKAAAKFRFRTKGLFCWRFCEDAVACIALGHRQDALRCVSRALRISPAHALRHSRQLGSILSHTINRKQPPEVRTAIH